MLTSGGGANGGTEHQSNIMIIVEKISLDVHSSVESKAIVAPQKPLSLLQTQGYSPSTGNPQLF